MPNLIDDLKTQCRQLQQKNQWRQRRIVEGPQGPMLTIDHQHQPSFLAFTNNDYLGLSNHPELIKAAREGLEHYGVGAVSSALLSGHSRAMEILENALADFVRMPRALHFSNGYMANLGIISALVGPGDTVWCDRLSHACIIDGVRLSGAQLRVYPHNDVERLQALLAKSSHRASSRQLVVTEGVFSMDGDIAPLPALLALCEQYDATLLVDDAHGFGVLGPKGRGSVAHFGLVSPRLLYMATLSKAAGVSGAFVAGDATIIDWLMQRARTYMFTTANPPMLASAALASLGILAKSDQRRQSLQARIQQLRCGLTDLNLPWRLLPSPTAIQALVVESDQRALEVMRDLYALGIWVPAIRPPTVPNGTARLRMSLRADHCEAHVDQLIHALGNVLKNTA